MLNVKLFLSLSDSHAHYDEPSLDGVRAHLFERLRQLEVHSVLNVSYDPASCGRTLELAAAHPGLIRAALGYHPQYIGSLTEADWKRLAELLDEPAVMAVGECGLDYRGLRPRKEHEAVVEAQRRAFRRQMKLAQEKGLPVVVHSVAAAEDTLRILKEYPGVCGLLHGFSYSVEMAQSFVSMGWGIGVGAVLLRPGAKKIRDVADRIPEEFLFPETDTPFCCREGRETGDPELLGDIIAELKRIKAKSV